MNPLTLYRSAPYIIIAVLIAALAWTTHLYLNKRDQLAALTATVQALGVAAEKVVEEKKAEYASNLQTVKEDHESLTSAIRATAVANYVRAHPNAGGVLNCSRSRTLCPTSSSIKVDDGTEQKPLLDGNITLDEATIRNAAEDASKVDAWQEWAKLNNLPVVE